MWRSLCRLFPTPTAETRLNWTRTNPPHNTPISSCPHLAGQNVICETFRFNFACWLAPHSHRLTRSQTTICLRFPRREGEGGVLGPDRQRSSVNVAGARASNRVVFRALASPPRTRSGGITMVPTRAFFFVGRSFVGWEQREAFTFEPHTTTLPQLLCGDEVTARWRCSAGIVFSGVGCEVLLFSIVCFLRLFQLLYSIN